MRQKQAMVMLSEKFRRHSEALRLQEEKRRKALERQEKTEEEKRERVVARKEQGQQRQIERWSQQLLAKSHTPMPKEASKLFPFGQRVEQAKGLRSEMERTQDSVLDSKLSSITAKQQEKERKRIQYVNSLTLAARSDNEAVARKVSEIAGLQKQRSYESLLAAEKRMAEYNRHIVISPVVLPLA